MTPAIPGRHRGRRSAIAACLAVAIAASLALTALATGLGQQNEAAQSLGVTLAKDSTTVTVSAPLASGLTKVTETNNGPNTVSADTGTPASGASFFYLIRGENNCPSGQGSLGNQSNGTPRTARTCP